MSVGNIIDAKESKSKPQVEETGGNKEIGPAPSENTKTISLSKAIEPAIALLLTDDEEIIISALKLSRMLNKNGITPRIYAGVGLGAVVAAALGFNMSADEIEWELFALERKGIVDKKEKAKSLLKKIITKDISQSFHVLTLPTAKGIWKTRGSLSEAVNFHLKNSGARKWPMSEIKNKIGADIVFEVNPSEKANTLENIQEAISQWKQSKS